MLEFKMAAGSRFPDRAGAEGPRCRRAEPRVRGAGRGVLCLAAGKGERSV